LLVVKTRPFDTFEGFGKIDETMVGGHGKNAKGARNPELFAPGDRDAVPIVHQNQVRVEFDSEGDSIFLASVECFHGRIMDMSGLMRFHP